MLIRLITFLMLLMKLSVLLLTLEMVNPEEEAAEAAEEAEVASVVVEEETPEEVLVAEEIKMKGIIEIKDTMDFGKKFLVKG